MLQPLLSVITAKPHPLPRTEPIPRTAQGALWPLIFYSQSGQDKREFTNVSPMMGISF
jgi:hypothetical protein